MRKSASFFVALAALVSFAAAAQPFPSKPVRFIVPFAPGGQSDVVARTVAQQLSERWGQPVVVENKPGAATTIGADFVAKSPADGYTIMLAPAPFVITQYAYPKLPYDGRKDFAPVALLVTNPLVVAVNPAKMSARNAADFAAEVKRQPGKFTYGTPGNGSLPHVAVELFNLRAGTSTVHVPYKGGAPAVTDLVGGQVDFMFASPLEVMQHVKAGRLAVVGATAAKRLPYWPDVPTMLESGVKDYEVLAWFGVVAPSGTPRDVLAKLSADVSWAIRSPDVAEKLSAQGADISGAPAEEFGRFLDAEHERWSAAVKAANVKIE
jgi:tripartite-type tricarboxylate transporter receptor subunit TctC